MALNTGSKLGPYEVVGLLGAGGMGEVYRARDSRLKREVAIKILSQVISADADRLHRFEQEALATAALNHPNILAVFDIGVSEGSPYAVSELLEGETLRERLRSGSIPVRKALDYALQITRGLAAAHEKGIVHRDLKPENLFVTKDGRVKILDFGLAKLAQADSSEHTSCRQRPTTPRPVWSWGPRATCLRSRCAAWRLTRAPTSLPSERFSTRCFPASGRFMARPPPTP